MLKRDQEERVRGREEDRETRQGRIWRGDKPSSKVRTEVGKGLIQRFVVSGWGGARRSLRSCQEHLQKTSIKQPHLITYSFPQPCKTSTKRPEKGQRQPERRPQKVNKCLGSENEAGSKPDSAQMSQRIRHTAPRSRNGAELRASSAHIL